jgi:hypothetical protein
MLQAGTLSHYDTIISVGALCKKLPCIYVEHIQGICTFCHIICSDVVLKDDLLYISCVMFNS